VLTQLADAFDGADQLVARGEPALGGAAEPDTGWSAGEDDVYG